MRRFLALLLVLASLIPIAVFGATGGNDSRPNIIAGTSELLEIVNDNVPYFTESDYARAAAGYFLELSPLDRLGRVGVVWGCAPKQYNP